LIDVTEWNQPRAWAAGEIISTATDLHIFMTALFKGKLVPNKELQYMFTVPVVPNWEKDGKEAGPATHGMGLMRITIKGITVWGKSGARYGYANGMFATRDLERSVVFSVNRQVDLACFRAPSIISRLYKQALR
jgi:D-alanyl-D-alanine carboxypeptidase